ncbi:MAG: hypothetical protein PHT19_08625 [Methylococcus sp.]|nr:hypothetical protein [Methylococcus sp.]
MATITFDTHKFIRKLTDAGMPTEQAEPATKGNIQNLEHRIDTLEYRLTIKLGAFIMLATGILIAVIRL